jgi:3-oxoacyl-[acyl-carrier protein] reductase
MDLEFRGETVAISAAGQGLGRSIAQAFARRGARVFACDISGEGLTATAEVPGIETAVVDLFDRAAAAAWIARVEAEGGGSVRVLVNNAGGSMGQVPGPLEEVSDEEWDRVFSINVDAMFAICRAAVPAMKRAGRGRIINISSGAGLKASIHPVQAYGAAKHAVVGMTRLLAAELGQYGITVNSVAPGLVLTNETREAQWERYGEAGRQMILQRLPLRRLATADDIAKAVLFFASGLADGVSGEILQVGGTI